MEYLLSQLAHPVIASAIILFTYMVWVFFIALFKHDNSIVDIGYGLGFILVTGVMLSVHQSPYGAIIASLVFIWGLRLAIRIHERNRKRGEDFRYRAWREKWVWFKTRSFFQIYMLQGAIILAIISPVLLAIAKASTTSISQDGFVFIIIGLCVWGIGFFFEVVGDYQLDCFIKNPIHKGTILDTGLWKFTRHPNYFGEATMWWGLWIAVLPILNTLGAHVVLGTFIASPFLITFLLVKVSGVPMLERAMETREGWSTYRAHTSMFIPWMPKK
jgi:steroid 5-alpha reductase family enzyme